MDKKIKTACLIQGNVRFGTKEVVGRIKELFDIVLFVTWQGEDVSTLNLDESQVLFLEKPRESGFSNRNLQRYSTAKGIERLAGKNIDYVMKWRSDMLPKYLNLSGLIQRIENSVTIIDSVSPIVVDSFRFLNSVPDFYSTIPDFYAFGKFKDIQLLWSDYGFTYDKKFNLPPDCLQFFPDSKMESFYAPEAELYAWFRYRVEQLGERKFCHDYIVRHFFIPVKKEELQIFWFANAKGRFRSIRQAFEHPWYSIDKNGFLHEPKVVKVGYNLTNFYQLFVKKISPFIVKFLEAKSKVEYQRNS